MHGVRTPMVSLSPKGALSLIDEALAKAQVGFDLFPSLAELHSPWKMSDGDSLSDEELTYLTLIDRAQYISLLVDIVLDERIGSSDDAGFRMRVSLKNVLDQLASCSARVLQYASDNPSKNVSTTGGLFELNWKRLGQRLIDEHDKRDTNEGDELS